MAEIRVQEGEPLENALRRFKRKVQTEDIIKEVKRHSFYLKPGEKKRVKEALARKRNRKKIRKEQDYTAPLNQSSTMAAAFSNPERAASMLTRPPAPPYPGRQPPKSLSVWPSARKSGPPYGGAPKMGPQSKKPGLRPQSANRGAGERSSLSARREKQYGIRRPDLNLH